MIFIIQNQEIYLKDKEGVLEKVFEENMIDKNPLKAHDNIDTLSNSKNLEDGVVIYIWIGTFIILAKRFIEIVWYR